MQTQHLALRSLAGEHQGRIWESDRLLQVGRLPTFEVTFTDSSVSRQHAEVAYTPQGWVVRDLGSTNGTFLNGVRIGRAEQNVRKGDILQFGELTMIVDLMERPSGIAPRAAVGGLIVAATLKGSWENIREALALARVPAPAGKDLLLALVQTGRDFYRFSSVDDYVQSILWEAAETLDAREGAILLRDETRGQLAVRSVFALDGHSVPEVWAKDCLATRAFDQGTSLLCHAVAAASDAPAGRRSVLYAVFRSPRGPLGVLCLAREAGQEAFSEADLKLTDALALSVSAGIDSLAHLVNKQRDVFLQTLTALTQVVEMRGDAIYGQTQRVTDYALLLAEELNLSEQDQHTLRIGVPLRDLGKIGINDAIFKKTGQLTAEEREQIRSHVFKGTALLESIPGLAALMPLVRSHHEWWDGSGYPDGLAGEQIPLLARVVAVAEAFDAVCTDRPYRRGLALPEAFAEIERHAGSQFDPQGVQALIRLQSRIENLVQERRQTPNTLSRDAIQDVVTSLGLKKRSSSKRPGSHPGIPGLTA